ncbi:MAG: HAD-IA family hydrolase [Candidatus Altiarchaeota archaeon]|nr:HAD-IA family hydrolase [Candidatus Altiarchaeota archaeon]
MIIVFDLDGTLVDAKQLHINAFSSVFEAQGIVIEPDKIAKHLHLPAKMMLMTLLERKHWSKISKIIGEHERYVMSNLDCVSATSGVYETLDAIKHRKVVFTAASRNMATRILDKFELSKYFELVITADDVGKSKPDPEGFFVITEKFDDPEMVIVGDKTVDIRAAKSAGAVSVLFNPDNRKLEGNPNYVIKALPELIGVIETLGLTKRRIFKV